MRYAILIAAVAVAGCQPTKQPLEHKSPWVITEVHHYETVKSQPTTDCQCATCGCDPCDCQKVKDTSADPKAVPVPDFYGPTKDARDILNESCTDGSCAVQQKTTKPVQQAQPQQYYEPQRGGLFRGGGIFRRGG